MSRITAIAQAITAADKAGSPLTHTTRADGRHALMDLNGTIYTPGDALDKFFPGGRAAARDARR